MKNAFRQVLAGVFIGIGGTVYLRTLEGWYAPFLFSVGLISVVCFGTPLYTGRIGYLPERIRENPARVLADYLQCLVLNFVGAALVGLPAGRYFSIDTSAMIARKLSETPLQVLLLSVGCGMLMYIAVCGYAKTKNIVLLVLPVAVFILCGFEHCVANAFYFAFNLEYLLTGKTWLVLLLAALGNSLGAIAVNLVTKTEE